MKVCVAGAGGMIGGHLVRHLLDEGHEVRAVDVKVEGDWWQGHPEAVNLVRDCSDPYAAKDAVWDSEHVYDLAASMGGIGWITEQKADAMMNVVIATSLLKASRELGVQRFFFSSSACAYSAVHQSETDATPLAEWMAYPAMPEDGYGWEKLFTERLCRHFTEDYGLETRVARFHNVTGIHGSWEGGREKAPAAICRKVAQAVVSGDHRIEIWGDGEQTRSFLDVADCVAGIDAVMGTDSPEPLNVGSDRLVTINELVSITEQVAGVTLERRYDLDAPQGVRGRNADLTLVRERTGWEPRVSLEDSIARLFDWILPLVRDATP